MSPPDVGILETVKDFFFNSDFEEKSLIKNPFIAPPICILYYVLVTHISPYVMRNRKPYNLRNVIIFYNLLLLIPNFYVVQGFVRSITGIFSETLCPEDSAKQFRKVMKAVQPYVWVFYLTKYVEFLDSIFFVMRKRFDLLTVLHRVHHAVVPVIVGTVMRYNSSVCLFLASAYNSQVHLFMYFYYAIAACGPRFRKYLWWKKYLTFLQIIQMMANIACITVNAFTKCYPTLLSEILLLCFSVFLLIMFVNYLIRQLMGVKQEVGKKKV